MAAKRSAYREVHNRLRGNSVMLVATFRVRSAGSDAFLILMLPASQIANVSMREHIDGLGIHT